MINWKWGYRFLDVAELVSGWSKDPSTKIGAVIVKDRKIVATGYNGFPPRIADDDRLQHRSQKYPIVVHAEMNALIQAGHAARGATLYLYSPFGGFPCRNCAKHIITSGITSVVTAYSADSMPHRWEADCEGARALLKEAGVQTHII